MNIYYFIKDLYKFLLIKLIKIIQIFKYRILGHKFSKDRLEILKHQLNLYSINLKNRKELNINYQYLLGSNIDKIRLIQIDIDKFTGYEGFYVFNGIAPLFNCAKELYENPKIRLEDSSLYHFYNEFQPINYEELYKLSKTNSLSKISSLYDFKPWLHSFINIKSIRNGLFGPINKNDIQHRFIRIKNILKNIEQFGYCPTEKDIIKGYLLISNNDYRFLITAGHHRVAALKAINLYQPKRFKKVLTKFEERRINLKAVYEKDIYHWPAVKSNFCSIQDAKELFYKYF